MNFISYAQNFEDVILWRAFQQLGTGFYIDIGAQDPIVDSVSYAFSQHGWCGVSVEPTKFYSEKIRMERPTEIVEQVAIGDGAGQIKFFEFPGTGLSTSEPEIATQHISAGFDFLETRVPIITLDALLTKYADRDIHWLKLDVEGMETSAIKSWRTSEVRPWVLVIESTVPMSEALNFDGWEDLIVRKNYEFAYFDGLNRFYVHADHRDLLEFFNKPINVFDRFSLSGTATHSFVDKIKDELFLSRENLDGQEKKVVSLEGALVLSEVRTHQLTEECAAANLVIADLGRKLHQFESDSNFSRAKWKEFEGKFSDANARIIRAEAENTALQNSYSWRLTKPFRRTIDSLIWVKEKLHEFASRILIYSIHLFSGFFTALVKRVLKNPSLTYKLNSKLIRYPAVHAKLKSLISGADTFANAYQNDSSYATNEDGHQPSSTRVLTRRARVILDELEIKFRESRG